MLTALAASFAFSVSIFNTTYAAQAKVDVHPGEVTTVMYEFRNRQARTMAAQAIPSYAPAVAMSRPPTRYT